MNRLILKELPQGECPHHRLEQFGPHSLKTSELIGLIIRSGSTPKACQVAEDLMQAFDGNLKDLAGKSESELSKSIKGLSEAKAQTIIAAFELGRRMAAYTEEKPQIGSPADVARLMMPFLRDLQKEELHVLCLDTKNNVTKQRRIFEGSLNASIIHAREVFKFAIESSAASILLVHNHPSGDPAPSPEDIAATKELKKGGELLQIKVTDHIIIGDGCYISMREENIISA